MKIKEYLIDNYLLNPDDKINLYFFIGPDTGLTDQRVKTLCKTLSVDINNPFNISRIDQNELEKNPSKLLDEALTYSLDSKKRFVFLKIYSESVSTNVVKSIKDLISHLPLKDTKVIISARNLSLSLPLVKDINDNVFCNTIVNYQKNAKDLKNEIINIFSQEGIKITDDALKLLELNLGDNQLITEKALENIISFVYPKKTIDYKDIIRIIPNSRLIEADQTVFYVFTGNYLETINNLQLLNSSGVSTLEIIRIFLKWSTTLKVACDIYKKTKSMDIAIKQSTPYVFWKVKPKFEESIKKCANVDLNSIIDRLLVLEKKIKSTPNLDSCLLSYSLSRLAKMMK